MRKFWKLIVIVSIAVIGLTAYYMTIHQSSKQYAQYKIETISGNDDMIENMSIVGEVGFGWMGLQSVTINQKGTTYFIDEPFFTQIDLIHIPDTIKKLRKEQRNFMRVKEAYTLEDYGAYFYEDDEMLAYVHQYNDFFIYYSDRIEIDVLNKQSKERSQFVVDLEDELINDEFLDLNKTMIHDGNLYVFTTIIDFEMNQLSIRVFVIDIEEEKLLRRDNLFETNIEDYYYHQNRLRVLKSDTKDNRVIVGSYDSEALMMNRIANMDGVMEGSNVDRLDVESEMVETIDGASEMDKFLITYDLEGQQKEDIILPGVQQRIPTYFIDDSIVFVSQDENTTLFETYNLTTDTIINTFELPGYHLIEEGRITSDGLFYFRTYDEHIPGFVYVVDLNTLNLVYEGEIIIEKAAKRQIDYEQMGWIDVID